MSDLERLRYAALRLTASHPSIADELSQVADALAAGLCDQDRLEWALALARHYVPDLDAPVVTA